MSATSSRPLLGVDLDNVLSASEAAMMVALERVTGRPIAELAASSYEALAAGLITRDEVLQALGVFHCDDELTCLDVVPEAAEFPIVDGRGNSYYLSLDGDLCLCLCGQEPEHRFLAKRLARSVTE